MPRSTNINLQSDDNFIRSKGELVHYYPGHKCSCSAEEFTQSDNLDQGTIAKDSLRTRSVCPICRGNGWWWDELIKFKAIITDINLRNARDLMVAGMTGPGDLILSPPPLTLRNIQVRDFGKLILPNRGGQTYEGDVIVRGQYDDESPIDYTLYPIASIQLVSWHNAELANPVIIRCIEGIDYSYTKADNKITWLEDAQHAPPVNTRYTVSYNAFFEWIVFVPPNPRLESGTHLAPRILLRRKHTVGMV